MSSTSSMSSFSSISSISPSSSDDDQMYWDPELAQIAQRHADQCRVKPLLRHHHHHRHHHHRHRYHLAERHHNCDCCQTVQPRLFGLQTSKSFWGWAEPLHSQTGKSKSSWSHSNRKMLINTLIILSTKRLLGDAIASKKDIKKNLKKSIVHWTSSEVIWRAFVFDQLVKRKNSLNKTTQCKSSSDIPWISGSPSRKNTWHGELQFRIKLSRRLFLSQWYQNQYYGTHQKVILLSLYSYIRLVILAFTPKEYNQSTTHNLIFLQSLRAPPHDWERAVKDWYNEVRLQNFVSFPTFLKRFSGTIMDSLMAFLVIWCNMIKALSNLVQS